MLIFTKVFTKYLEFKMLSIIKNLFSPLIQKVHGAADTMFLIKKIIKVLLSQSKIIFKHRKWVKNDILGKKVHFYMKKNNKNEIFFDQNVFI